MKKFLIAAISCLALGSCLHSVNAADMPVKARIIDTYTGFGWYGGVHTFVENQKLDANGTGVFGNLGGTFAVGAAIGPTVGVMRGNGSSWQAFELMASYKNIGASAMSNTGTQATFDSNWSFTERVKIGGPIATVLNLIPNLSTIFPVIPTIPNAVGAPRPYLFGAAHQDDVSSTFGAANGKVWRVKGGFGIGVMQALGNAQNMPTGSPIVMDVWAEYIAPGSQITLGNTGPFTATMESGRETRIGMSILY